MRLLAFVPIYSQYLQLRNVPGDKGGTSLRESAPLRVLGPLTNLLYSCFIIMDNVSLLSRLSFLHINEQLMLQLGHLFWFTSIILSVVMHSIRLTALAVKEEKLIIK